MMKLLFLGTASGLSTRQDNYQSNMVLIADNGKKLLMDCGTDIRFSLTHAHMTPDDMDGVYISHLHADHVGGLEWFGLSRKFKSALPKPKLFIHHELAKRLWNKTLSGGMDTLDDEKATLSSYFNVHALNDGEAFTWEGAQFELVQTEHVVSNGRLMPSYGLFITYKKAHYFITTDTQFCEQRLMPYYQRSRLIFNDCETSAFKSGVHAHFSELSTLSPAIKQNMWLYHYSDGDLPNAQHAGFLGFVVRGQVIDLD